MRDLVEKRLDDWAAFQEVAKLPGEYRVGDRRVTVRVALDGSLTGFRMRAKLAAGVQTGGGGSPPPSQ